MLGGILPLDRNLREGRRLLGLCPGRCGPLFSYRCSLCHRAILDDE